MVAYLLILVQFQTPEVLELSRQIKEKLKEVDQFGNLYLIAIFKTELAFSLVCLDFVCACVC